MGDPRHGRPIAPASAAELFSGGERKKDEQIPPPRIMRPRSLAGLSIPPRQWLVPDWIPWGVVTGLYGAGGLGKSLIAQQLQTAAALRTTWLGLQTTPIRSLGIYCEDPDDELWRRQAAINKAYGCDFGDLEDAVWMPRLGDENLLIVFGRGGKAELTQFHARVIEAAKDHRAGLVTVDTVSDTFGGNEIDRGQVKQYVSYGLGSIAKAISGSVLCLAHPSRSGMATGDGGSGSTGWDGAFRSRLYLHEPESERGIVADPDVRILSRKKANYAARHEAFELRWRDGVLARTGTAEGGDQGSERAQCCDVFLAILDGFDKNNRTVSENSHSANYAPRIFAKHPDRCGYRQADFSVAMERLFASGRIGLVEYGRAGDRRRKIQRREEVGA